MPGLERRAQTERRIISNPLTGLEIEKMEFKNWVADGIWMGSEMRFAKAKGNCRAEYNEITRKGSQNTTSYLMRWIMNHDVGTFSKLIEETWLEERHY